MEWNIYIFFEWKYEVVNIEKREKRARAREKEKKNEKLCNKCKWGEGFSFNCTI